MEQIIKLSIVIPVYNVEKYISACIESIYRQGIKDDLFEIIIVNDGTKDNSMNIIHDFSGKHNNIVIIEQENQGQGAARNNGLDIAKGDYVLMIDSDDMLFDNSLAKLLNVALSSNADLVLADFMTMSDDDINNINNLCYTNDYTIEEKNGKQLFVEDLDPHECFIRRTLYKTAFLNSNGIRFEASTSPYEDVPFTHECYLKANKCIKTTIYLNIYRRGHESTTYTVFSEKRACCFCRAISKTWQLSTTKETNSMIQKKLNNDVYTSFCVMINLVCKANNIKDKAKILLYFRSLAPNLNFTGGIKKHITTILIKKHLSYTYLSITRT